MSALEGKVSETSATPSYMGVDLKAGGSPDLQPPCSWNYDQPPKQSPLAIGSRSPLSPKKTGQTLPSHDQTGKPGEHFSQQSVQTPDDGKPPEMFNNPWPEGSGHPRANRKVLAPSDAHFFFLKTQEEPPFPTPSICSFTCSETKGAVPSSLPASPASQVDQGQRTPHLPNRGTTGTTLDFQIIKANHVG